MLISQHHCSIGCWTVWLCFLDTDSNVFFVFFCPNTSFSVFNEGQMISQPWHACFWYGRHCLTCSSVVIYIVTEHWPPSDIQYSWRIYCLIMPSFLFPDLSSTLQPLEFLDQFCWPGVFSCKGKNVLLITDIRWSVPSQALKIVGLGHALFILGFWFMFPPRHRTWNRYRMPLFSTFCT